MYKVLLNLTGECPEPGLQCLAVFPLVHSET
jgi:hypothetical protein